MLDIRFDGLSKRFRLLVETERIWFEMHGELTDSGELVFKSTKPVTDLDKVRLVDKLGVAKLTQNIRETDMFKIEQTDWKELPVDEDWDGTEDD